MCPLELVLTSLLVLSSCVVTGPGAAPVAGGEVLAGRIVVAAPERVFAAACGVFQDLEWELVERAEASGVLSARSTVERRFFAVLGEREKSTRATLTLLPVATGVAATRTRVRVQLELSAGPAGAEPTEVTTFEDPAWEDDFFQRLRRRLGSTPSPPSP